MIIYQILFVSKVLRITGWIAYKDILPEDFWMKDDLSFIKIIFGYQILFTQYRCWVQSLIHKQKVNQNLTQPFETLSNQIKISLIQKFNQKFNKNGFVDQVPDFDFLGSYTKICNPQKNRSKANAVQQDKISKRMLTKSNSSIQIGLDMYDNLCTCLLKIFFQIAEKISVPPQKDDLKRILKEYQLQKDELVQNSDCFEEKFNNDFCLNLQTAITKNKLNHNKFSNIKSLNFSNFLKLQSNQFNDQMIDEQYSLDDFLFDHKNNQRIQHFYQQEQKVLIKIEKIEFDKNLYLLQFEIFQKNDKIQINVHDEDVVISPGESLESKRVVRPIEIEIMNRTLSSNKKNLSSKKMKNRSHKSHQNIQSFVSPLINKQNIQQNNLSSRLNENDEQQAQRRGFSFGSADYIEYDYAIRDNIRQNQENKSLQDYRKNSLLSPNKNFTQINDFFQTDENKKFIQNSSCSDSSIEASPKSNHQPLFKKQQTHVSFQDDSVQFNNSFQKSGQISSSDVQEETKNIVKQRRKTLERGKSHIVEKNENVQKMINYIDQSEFNQEAISETNKKKEMKNKLVVNGKQRKLVRQKTQTMQHKKKCSKISMADQVLQMMKDEQEKKELQFLKQLEYQIEQQIESNQNSQTVKTSKFKQSQKKLQQYLIKGVHLTTESKPSNNQLQNCQNMDTQKQMQQTFQEQLISLKNIISQKEQILKQKQNIHSNNELNFSKKNNLKGLIDSRETDQKKDNQKQTESHFTLNQSILNNKFNAKSQTLKQLIEHYENKIEQKQAALEFFKNKTKNLQQSLDSNKIFLNMAVHDMRNPTNQVEFLVSESLKSLKEIQKLNQEMQQMKIQNQEQFQSPVQIISMGQISNQQIHIGEQEERIFKRELIIEEEEKVHQAEDEIQIELMNNNQNQFHNISSFDQQIQINHQNKQSFQNQEQLFIQDQQPQILLKDSLMMVKQGEIKQTPKINSIHHKFQKDDKRKNIVKKQQIKAQISKEKKKQSFQISIKKKRSDMNILNSAQSEFEKSDQSNIKILENFVNSQIVQDQDNKQLINDIKKEKEVLEKKLVENKINQMGVLVQNIQIKEEHISLQRKQFYKDFNIQNKLIQNSSVILNENKNCLFLNQIQAKDDKKNFVENLYDLKNHLIYQGDEKEKEDFEFNEQDQEPYITKQLAQQMHLSHDRYLLLLNQQKVKKYLKCELQKLTRNSGVCNIEINQFQKKCSQKTQTEEDNTIKEFIGNLENQNSQLVKQFNQYETQIQLKLQNLEKNLANVINKLENCKYCSTMLLNLINDMMDLAKSEKMKFELNCEFFDLTKTIERAFDTLSYFKDQKNITTHFIIDKNIQPFFQNFKGDENRFSQIFLNFLSNAFKFTSQNGTIWMEVCQNGDQEFCQKIFPSKDLVLQNKNVLELLDQSQINLNQQIQTEIDQNQIQESQQKLDEYYISFQVRIKDSGMGIAKENLGKLFLNFGKLQDTIGCNKQGTGLGLSICKHIIEKMGGKVHVESDGVGTGTTFVITMQAISKIDISILNNSENQLFFQLHKTKKESSSQKFNNQILIEQKEKILKDQKEALKQAQIFQNIQIEPQVNDAIKDIKSMKVLVINDEFFILQMLIMMVKQTEITDIDTAQNGFDGFNMVKAKQYDFILCDLNMPVMDGFECIQKIKEHYQDCNSFFERSSYQQIFCPYLVACSAFINSKIEQKAITAGFELIVESPLTYKILKDTIIPNTLDRYKEKQVSNIIKTSNSLKYLNLSQISIDHLEIDSNSRMQIKNLIEQIDEDLQEIQDQNIKMYQQQQLSDSPESDNSNQSSDIDDLSSYKNGSSNLVLERPKQRYSNIQELDEEQLEDNDYNRKIQIIRKKESVISIQMSQKQNSSDDDNSISVQENSELNSQHSKSRQIIQKQLKKIKSPSIEQIVNNQRNRMIHSYNPRYQNGSQKSDRSLTDKSSADYQIIHNPSQGSMSQESIMMSIKKPKEINKNINKRSFFSQQESMDSSDSSSSLLEVKEKKHLKIINEKLDKSKNILNQQKHMQLSVQKQSSENKKQFYKQVSFNRQVEDENDKISKQMAINKQLQIRKKPSFAEKVQIANDSFKQNQYQKAI